MKVATAERDVQRYYGENLRFHWAIVEATRNQSPIDTYRGIVQKLHLSRLKSLAHDFGMQTSIAEHADIVQALRDGDPAGCERLLAEHVSSAHGRLAAAPPLTTTGDLK